mgnify:CR=1 FL=1
MKENKTLTGGGKIYCTPLCITTDIESEGVLCNSFETPLEYDDEYAW